MLRQCISHNKRRNNLFKHGVDFAAMHAFDWKARPVHERSSAMPGNGNRDLEGLSFDEIAERYGEEAAIAAGIAADPDARELTDDDFRPDAPGLLPAREMTCWRCFSA